jgi:peptide/histidine transporter 3/4
MKKLYERYKKGLKDRKLNFPGCILIYYSLTMGMCTALGFNITLSLVTDPEPPSCWYPIPETQGFAGYILEIFQGCLYFILYPLVGWIADTVVGRGKLIRCSVWLCWCGSLLQVVSSCIQFGTCGIPVSIAKYGISLIALVCLMVGTASYQTNILAYGLDQLYEYSNAHIRAFVHWIVWGQFIGFIFSYVAFSHQIIYDSKVTLITLIFIFSAVCVAVIIDSIFHINFKPVGVLKKNPYRLVYNVLKYAKDHKYAVNRSAFTYWDNKTPSRMDFGKMSYGGPYTEDEVEAVKTFLRIVLVFVSSFGFYIPHYILVNGALPFVNVFQGALTDIGQYGSYILWNFFNKLILFLVPALELVILPLFPKVEYFILNPLKSITVAFVFLLLTLISMLILDTTGHIITPNDICFLNEISDHSSQFLNISFYVYSIPLLFSGLATVIAYVSFLEFICSQAPVNMSGMTTGIFYVIRGVYTSLGPYLQTGLKEIPSLGPITCSFWILLANLCISVCGFVVYLFVVKYYSKRRRGEDYHAAKVIEEKYENYFNTEYIAVQSASTIQLEVYDVKEISIEPIK